MLPNTCKNTHIIHTRTHTNIHTHTCIYISYMFVFAGATLDGFPELYGPRLLRHRDSIIDFSFFFHFSFHFAFSFSSSRTRTAAATSYSSSSSRSSCLLPSPPPTKLRWQRTSTCMQSDTICIEECAYMPIYTYIYIYTLYRIRMCWSVCVRVVVCHFSAAAVACHSARHAAATGS